MIRPVLSTEKNGQEAIFSVFRSGRGIFACEGREHTALKGIPARRHGAEYAFWPRAVPGELPVFTVPAASLRSSPDFWESRFPARPSCPAGNASAVRFSGKRTCRKGGLPRPFCCRRNRPGKENAPAGGKAVPERRESADSSRISSCGIPLPAASFPLLRAGRGAAPCPPETWAVHRGIQTCAAPCRKRAWSGRRRPVPPR